jgi:hypothetical protein
VPVRGATIGFLSERAPPVSQQGFRARAAATGWREITPRAPAALSFVRAGRRADVSFWDTGAGTVDVVTLGRRDLLHVLAGILLNVSLLAALLAGSRGSPRGRDGGTR